MNRTGALFRSQPEGFPHLGGDGVGVADLAGVLGKWPHQVHHIQDLEQPLFGRFNGLLPGNHHHWHAAELGIGSGGYQVGGPRAQGRQANAHTACQAPVGRGHKAGCLLVTIEHQLNAGFAQGLKEIQVFFTRYREDVPNTFVFQGTNKQLGAVAAGSGLSGHHLSRSGLVGSTFPAGVRPAMPQPATGLGPNCGERG